MSTLTETSQWDDGIYQLETTDPVEGGPDGVDNVQAKALANRTKFLKDLIETFIAAKSTLAQAQAGTDDATWMTPAKVASAISVLVESIAAATETTAGKVELATAAETITGADAVRATHPAGVKAAIAAAIASLVNSAPGTLDTLNEIATALGNDPNFTTSMTTLLAGKLAISSKSSTAQAQAGSDDATWMTPLKVAQAIAALQSGGRHPGDIFATARNTPPAGSLKANGAAVSRVTYSALFVAIGTTFGAGDGVTTFNLPDLRGEFIRGWDDGRGVDTGRAFGSSQGFATQDHTHASSAAANGNQTLAEGINGAAINGSTTGSMNSGSIASETRPRNVALLACIQFQ